MMANGPVFIGGVERSGKTYMRLAISAHPNIFVQQRTGMWPAFYNRYGDLGQQENFERCLAAMLRSKHIRMLQPDPDRIRREFWQGAPTYPRLFALFHEHHLEKLGKPRWGDQTELIEQFADTIFTAYPAARMIHMIRDPRDRYEAILRRKPQARGKAGKAISRWLYSVKLAGRNLERYPDRYKIIRYEALVSHPEVTLRQVCDFLGEDFVPAMLTLENVPRFQHRKTGEVGRTPLSTEYIGRFREGLSAREIAFIQTYTGQKLVEYGYEMMLVDLSISQFLALYLFDWPLNLARIIAWRSKDGFERNFSRRGSRQPATQLVA
ncbi:MAG: sulfotransferase [Candidatus Methanosuratincola sp.]